MYQKSYKLWVDYSLGKVKRKLTQKEQREIQASQFATELLIPTNSLLRLCGGLQNVEVLVDLDFAVEALSQKFLVPKEVMFIKMKGLLQNEPELPKKEEKNRSFIKKKMTDNDSF